MKKIFEEYRHVIIGVLAIALVVGLGGPISAMVGEQTNNLVSTQGEEVNSKIPGVFQSMFEGGGTENNPTIEYLSLGGKVFLDNGDNGATYKFYNADKNEIAYTDIDDLDDAVYYSVEGTPTSDRFYVVASDSSKSDYNSTYGVNLIDYLCWGYYQITTGATTDSIGSGKTNTATILTITDTSGYYEGSIWEWLNDVNFNEYGGCNDWFIGSEAEYNALRTSGKAGSLFDSELLWSSVENDSYSAYRWRYDSLWERDIKDSYYFSVVAFRAF